jgi:hypothetical protein
MIPMKRAPKESTNGFPSLPTLTSVVLAVCFLLGPGFRNFAAHSFAANTESRLTNSSPIDAAVTSSARQIRFNSNGPRRQLSYGALPAISILDLRDGGGERTIAKARPLASVILSFPNDRAPPYATV